MISLKTDVSVIIVSYNTKELLTECLNSISEFTKDVNYEVLVIDNGSKDGTLEILKNEYSHIKLVENSNNIGFGRACNIGIEKALGEYVFLLNSDTKLTNNAVYYFYNYFLMNNGNNCIGALGSILLDNDLNPTHSVGYFPKIINLTKFLQKENIIEKEMFTSGNSNHYEVEYITGANLFIKKDVIISLGKFDSDFFMYYEETDLQKRMQRLNLKRIVINGPKIIHHQGKSFRGNMIQKKKLMKYRSMFLYHRKNSNLISYILLLLFYHFFYFPLLILKKPLKKESYLLLSLLIKNKN
jgi:GT2 family glycosyltransferase